MPRRLDYWAKEDTFKWLDEREDEIFARYLEIGNIKRVIEELRDHCNGLGFHTFYAWLRYTDDREDKWDAAREMRGHLSAAEAEEIAEQATQKDANASRLKWDQKRWAAEHQNRAVYGKRPDVQLAVGVGDEWAKALEALFDKPRTIAQPIPEAEIISSHVIDHDSPDIEASDPSKQSDTRALPGSSSSDEGA